MSASLLSTLKLTAARKIRTLPDLVKRRNKLLQKLTEQRDLAQAESGLIDTQRSQLNAVVSLYKALGGGWETTAAQ